MLAQLSARTLVCQCPWSITSIAIAARRNYVRQTGNPDQETSWAGERSTGKENTAHRREQGKSVYRGAKAGKRGDTKDITISKNMSWLLRHGAKKQGLAMRSDGYVRVQDLLSHPVLRGVDFLTLERVVKEDKKQRYHLLHDSNQHALLEGLTQTNTWWIRANQGHTLSEVQLDLKRIFSADQVSMAVHGTSVHAWESISIQGLSRMGRNHIHLAQAVAGENVVSGMRNSSQILIYINLQKALDAGLEFYLSSNGVVLTQGNDLGFLEPQFFEKVEGVKKGVLPGWEGQVEIQLGCEEDKVATRGK